MKAKRGYNIYLGVPFRPGFHKPGSLSVDIFSTCSLESINSPLLCALHGRSARDAATNFVGKDMQVLFKRRRLLAFRNQFLRRRLRQKIAGKEKQD